MKLYLFIFTSLLITKSYGQSNAIGLKNKGGYENRGLIYSVNPKTLKYDTIYEFRNPNHIQPLGSNILKGSNGKLYLCGTNKTNTYISEYNISNNELHSFPLGNTGVFGGTFLNHLLRDSLILSPIGGNTVVTFNIYTKEVIKLKKFSSKKMNGKLLFRNKAESYVGIWQQDGGNSNGIVFEYDFSNDSLQILDTLNLMVEQESVFKKDSVLYGIANERISGPKMMFEYNLISRQFRTTDTISNYLYAGNYQKKINTINYNDSLFYFVGSGSGVRYHGAIYQYNNKSKKVAILHSFDDTVGGKHPYGFARHNDEIFIQCLSGGDNKLGTIETFDLKKMSITNIFHMENKSNCRSPVMGSYFINDSTYLGQSRNGGNDSLGNIYLFNISQKSIKELKGFIEKTLTVGSELHADNKYSVIMGVYNFYKLWPYSHKYEYIASGGALIPRYGIGTSFKTQNGNIYNTGQTINNNKPGALYEVDRVNGNIGYYNSYNLSDYGTPNLVKWAEIDGKLYNTNQQASYNRHPLLEFDIKTKNLSFVRKFKYEPIHDGIFADTLRKLIYLKRDTTPPGSTKKLQMYYIYDVVKKKTAGHIILDIPKLNEIGISGPGSYFQVNDSIMLGYSWSGSKYSKGALYTINMSSHEVKFRQAFNSSDTLPSPTNHFSRLDSNHLIYPCKFGANTYGVARVNINTWKSDIIKKEVSNSYGGTPFISSLVTISSCIPRKIVTSGIKLDTFFQVCSNSIPPNPKIYNNCGDIVKSWTDAKLPLNKLGSSLTITWYLEDDHGNKDSIEQIVVYRLLDRSIHRFGDTLRTLQKALKYQWIDCLNGRKPILGETKNYFIQNKTGSYAVELTTPTCTKISQCNFKCYLDTIIPQKSTLETIHSYCGVDSITPPIAITNCNDTLVARSSTSFPLKPKNDTITINWEYSYKELDTVYQQQTVILSIPDTTLTRSGFVLSSNDINAEYQWYECKNGSYTVILNEKNKEFRPKKSGTYSVQLKHNSCTIQSECVSICIPEAPIPILANLPTVNRSCVIDTIIPPKSYNQCGDTFIGTSLTKFPITFIGETIIEWKFEDSSGNKSSQNQKITISLINDSVEIESKELIAKQTNCTYQWLDCLKDYEPIIGANQRVFIPSKNGIYAVKLDKDGCSDTSSCFPFNNLDYHNLDKSNIIIVPNPGDRFIKLLNLGNGNYTINLFSTTGKRIKRSSFTKGILDISDLPKGLYLLEVRSKSSDKSIFMGSFIKQ